MSISNEKIFYYLGKNNLDGFCNEIIAELKGKRLIGEIELEEGKATFINLQSHLKKHANTIIDNDSKKIRTLLSVYLVWLGIYNYGLDEDKTFWRHFFKSLNLPEKNSSLIGQKFLNTIKELNLQTFSNIEEKNHTYVSRILLHGFIPDKDIERFIGEFILDNSYNEFFYTSSDLLNDWKNKIPNKVPKVPTSIERFIKYAKPVNEVVIDRFLEIKEKWDYSNQGENENWGLPDYMVKAFFNILKRSNVKTTYNITKRPNQLPELKFSLDRLILYIPTQTLNTYKPELIIKCISKSDTELIEKELSCYRSYDSFITDDITISVPVADRYEINLAGTYYNIFSNTINSGTNSLTFFTFSSSSGRYINVFGNSSIPNEIVLVTESNTAIVCENVEQITEESEFLKGWKYCYYRLLTNSVIKLVKDNNQIKYYLPIKSSMNSINVFFEGGEPLPYWVEALNNFPLFANQQSLRLKISDVEPESLVRIKITNLNTHSILYNSNLSNLEYFYFSSLEQKLKSGLYEIKISQNLSNPILLNFIILNEAKFYRYPDKCSTTPAEQISFSLPEDLKYEILDIEKLQINKKDNLVEINNINSSCCRLKILTNTLSPLTLILSRMDIKWSKHADKGIIDWNAWTVEKEDLTISEIGSLKDKRVLVELNNIFTDKKFDSKIKLELKDDKTLLTFITPKLIRKNNKLIFIFDLSGFASHLKDLKYFSANICLVVPYISKLQLFNLSLQPKFENLLIKTVSITDKENIEVSWANNEKVTNDTLNFVYAPASCLENGQSVTITNQSPIFIPLPIPSITEEYLAYLEVNHNKFKSKKTTFDIKRPYTSWIRKIGYEFISFGLKSLEQNLDNEVIQLSWDKYPEENQLNKAFVYYSCSDTQELFYKIIPKNNTNFITIKLPNTYESGNWKGQVFVFEDNFDIKNVIITSKLNVEWFRQKFEQFTELKVLKIEASPKSESLTTNLDYKKSEAIVNSYTLSLSIKEKLNNKSNRLKELRDANNKEKKEINDLYKNEIFTEVNDLQDSFFQNLTLETIGFSQAQEKVIIIWEYKENEPNSKTLSLYDENNNCQFSSCLNDKLSPVIINLPVINVDKSYMCILEYNNNSGYKSSKATLLKRKGIASHIQPFYDLCLDDKYVVLKNAKGFTKIFNIYDYFVKFIALFNSSAYNDKREFYKFLGQENIESLLPYSTNAIFNVKVNKNKFLTFKIFNSQYKNKFNSQELARNFYSLPEIIDLNLKLIKKDDRVITTLESSFLVNINKDTVIVNDERFDSITSWIDSLVYLKGRDIDSLALNSVMPLDTWLSPPKFNFLFLLEKNILKYENYKEEDYLFNYLIDKWRDFYNNFAEDGSLFDNIQIELWFWYRLENNHELDFLSGCISIFYRLKSHKNSTFIKFKTENEGIKKEFLSLIDKTTFFIKKYKQIQFIRDLVLAEFFINWYFYKNIYQYQKNFNLRKNNA